MDVAEWGAAEWAAAGAVAAAVVYVVLGVFGFIQLLQAKQLRELQTRPYVIVDFDFRRSLIYVAVKNIGQTPARDVAITFDKPFQTTGKVRSDVNTAAIFNGPIPMLAPGRVVRVTFDVSFEIMNREDLPLSYDVELAYTDLSGERKYKDPKYTMDLAHLRESALSPKGMPELVGELEAVRQEMHKWTDGSRGLLAFTMDRRSYTKRMDRPHWRSTAASIRKDQGWLRYLRWLLDHLLTRYGWR